MNTTKKYIPLHTTAFGVCEKCGKSTTLYHVREAMQQTILVCFACYDRLKKENKIERI